MRIALVSPYDFAYPGGVTEHVNQLGKNLAAMGHYVRIIAPSSVPADRLGRDNLRVIGHPFPIPASGSIARISLSLRLAAPVKALLNAENFDVIHLHEPLVPVLPITVLRFSQSVNVGTFHAYHGSNRAYSYGKRLLKRWFRKLHGKIAVSRPAMEFVSKYFPGYYNIIPNGIDVVRFSGEKPPLERHRDGKLNILFVGRLEKRKGVDCLLKAYVLVKREFPDSRLIVAGPETGLREGYEKFVREKGLRDVVFAGYVSDEDLPRYYETADVFCAPATGWESFGIVLLEAMASARPIVASDIEGYAGVVTHGSEGLLVPPKDEKALAMALGHLLADKELRQRMGARGREKAQEYSWERVSRRVANYYEGILKEGALTRKDEPVKPKV
ncbi:MAG: glycosyltransferase family 4 protein [Chloroflexi bacterium]|nr:glycosyltransferase family 4 protein [Chloroflexota bacterium]